MFTVYTNCHHKLHEKHFAWTLLWRHNWRDSVSNHQPHDCLLNRLFRRRSKQTLKLRVTGLCAGNSPGTGEFPAQMASNAENVSIWWRHHDISIFRGKRKQMAWDLFLPCFECNILWPPFGLGWSSQWSNWLLDMIDLIFHERLWTFTFAACGWKVFRK